MLLLSTLSFTSCAAPALEDIYDRVVELVESSHEINTVFYGVGLPVYAVDSEYVMRTLPHLYYGFSQKDSYEFVSEHAKFADEASIREAAAEVYGTAQLSIFADSAFTGHAIEDSIGGSVISRARYLEQVVGTSRRFCQSTEKPNIDRTAMRIYDYSTMQVHSLGRSDACTVSMNTYLENSPDVVTVIELHLILENGVWYLDSFTGA